MGTKRVEYDEFASHFCSVHKSTRDTLLTKLLAQKQKHNPVGWVLLQHETEGCAILPYGGGCVLQAPPDQPMSPRDGAAVYTPVMRLLVDDLPAVYKVKTADGVEVDEVEIGSPRVRVRHGDDLFISSDDENVRVKGQVAKLLPDRMWFWPYRSGVVSSDDVVIPYHTIKKVQVVKRRFEDPPPEGASWSQPS